MINTDFNVDGLKVWIGNPEAVHKTGWEEMQGIAHSSVTADFPDRSTEEIDYLLHTNNVERFSAGRIDPDIEVQEGRMHRNQSFENIKVVIVAESAGPKAVKAYGIISDNTSNKDREPKIVRDMKMRTPPGWSVPLFGNRKHGAVREIMVPEEERERGLGWVVLYFLSITRNPKQPEKVYEFNPSLELTEDYINLGLSNITSERRQVFGPGSEEVKLVAFGAKRAATVSDRIIALGPTAKSAIDKAKASR